MKNIIVLIFALTLFQTGYSQTESVVINKTESVVIDKTEFSKTINFAGTKQIKAQNQRIVGFFGVIATTTFLHFGNTRQIKGESRALFDVLTFSSSVFTSSFYISAFYNDRRAYKKMRDLK